MTETRLGAHRALPRGYRFVEAIDFARNRRQMIAVFKWSLALLIAPLALGFFIAPIAPSWRYMTAKPLRFVYLMLALVAYIPLHELTHGIVMFALSGVPPRYGIRLPYAWCGSDAWLPRASHNIVALAPVVVWGILIQIAVARLPGEAFWPLWILQISNLSGSAGDLWCVWHLSRLKGNLLIQDAGTRMRVVRKVEPPDADKGTQA